MNLLNRLLRALDPIEDDPSKCMLASQTDEDRRILDRRDPVKELRTLGDGHGERETGAVDDTAGFLVMSVGGRDARDIFVD